MDGEIGSGQDHYDVLDQVEREPERKVEGKVDRQVVSRRRRLAASSSRGVEFFLSTIPIVIPL